MSFIRITTFAILLFSTTLVVGCGSSKSHVFDGNGESQAQLRSIQTRAVDAKDKKELLHAVMASLQDLGFVIDDANDMIGTITATRMSKYALKMTVSVRSRGLEGGSYLVRANLQHKMEPVTEADPYRQFFTTLSKSQFLTVNEQE
jgi:hypothetical protein